MAAYAALVSLMNLMEHMQNHPRHSFSFNNKQMESLRTITCFLLDFIESYNPRGSSREEAEALESQIASAAYEAEDVIESHIFDQIHAGTTLNGVTSSCFLIDVQKAIDDMESIKKMATKVKVERGSKDEVVYAYSSKPETAGKSNMVGFDEVLVTLMEMLTRQHSSRQIIPIVGMGGIGKTTLARNAYEHLLIKQHFDVCLWATISQEYSAEKILVDLLSSQGKSTDASQKVHELGEQLHKSLKGSVRYLIILDDMWSIESWEEIQLFLPDNCNGSSLVVTTRLSNLAAYFRSPPFEMKFLDEDTSWKLFCEKTFGEEDCPRELEEMGKMIVNKCKGLPLSIVVIGGHLRKSPRTKDYWYDIAIDINSVLDSGGEDEQCSSILSLSYSHLPAYLKPCFLYMGVFGEDSMIRVVKLIRLWVSEGFLKPREAQSLEEVAEGYLRDLIERNLILACEWGLSGNVKTCKVHDLLRDLSIRLAKREKFFCDMRGRGHKIPPAVDTKRRFVFYDDEQIGYMALGSTSVARSLICNWAEKLSLKLRLLRLVNVINFGSLSDHDSTRYSLTAIFDQVNLQYLACENVYTSYFKIPSSISLLWKVETLILRGIIRVVAPPEIWELPRLRHVEFDEICLPDPPSGEQKDDVVLKNLHTLRKIVNFKWTENACKRIPNIKKLHTSYDDLSAGSDYCLYNIGNLHTLESLSLLTGNLPERGALSGTLILPSSLKKLSLTKCQLHWEDLTMIGVLPRLEVLKLGPGSVIGPEWNPVEGEFPCLKYLKIYYSHLMTWNAESSHFPVLECLVLDQFFKLDEIPFGIGEIPTLKAIHLNYCKESAVISAMQILEEQESLGNDGLQVRAQFWTRTKSIKEFQQLPSFTSNNFSIAFKFKPFCQVLY